MPRHSLSHLSDRTLPDELAAVVARDRSTTAELLAHIAEVDARKLYLTAAYASMLDSCVDELRLSEDAAFEWILAARTARRFPVLFEALADGRLHLSAVILLAPHLTEETAGELLLAATHKSTSEIERLLAERIPGPVVPSRVQEFAPHVGEEPQLGPGRVGEEPGDTPEKVG